MKLAPLAVAACICLSGGAARAQTPALPPEPPPPSAAPPPSPCPPSPSPTPPVYYSYPPAPYLPAPAGAYRHDGFFYLHIALGPNYTSMKGSAGGAERRVFGTGLGLVTEYGGALRDNLVVFGVFSIDEALSPAVESGHVTTSLGDTTVDTLGWGAGMAYYFMPANVYLSGALVFTETSISDTDGNAIEASLFGAGVSLAVGKEWWVSPNWALGFGARIVLASNRRGAATSGILPRGTTTVFSSGFSATFN